MSGRIQLCGLEHQTGIFSDRMVCRFHGIYWPAILRALNLPLPARLLAHGHWTLGYRKMSKSSGNVVNPFFALDRFGTDPIRFYMAHDGGLRDDADYGNTNIIERYNKLLRHSLGNLCSRITRGTDWSVRAAVMEAQRSRLAIANEMDRQQQAKINQLRTQVDEAFQELEITKALKIIFEMVGQVRFSSFSLSSLLVYFCRFLLFAFRLSLAAFPAHQNHVFIDISVTDLADLTVVGHHQDKQISARRLSLDPCPTDQLGKKDQDCQSSSPWHWRPQNSELWH